tara:strand:- start:1957 stop:2802 length:846 start_codon:yes stop_codon:yes gene_type:complete
MTQISELINNGSKILKKNLIPSHQLDSELILSSILKKSRESMLISLEEQVSKEMTHKFNRLLERRIKKEPIAYIFKEKEFWNKKFMVSYDTLIPRPETELLLEKTVKYFKDKKPFVLDMGTGSGCILLSFLEESKGSKGIGIDISSKALNIAFHNSRKFGFTDRAKFYKRSIDQICGYKFDLIISNPPYICSNQMKNLSEDIIVYEPKIALDGGNDGLDVIKKVIYKSRSILKKKGMLALEIGNGQYRKVAEILRLNNFRDKFLIKDYQDNVRCIISILEN